MSNSHYYREIKHALKNQIQEHLNAEGESIDVYSVPYQNIAFFPAVCLELTQRRKVKKGLGVRELELDIVVWVYVNILDSVEADDECNRIMEVVEDAIEKDKRLGGVATYLSTDEPAEFGTVQNGEAGFLQGGKLLVTVKRLMI